jgi:hypothetical protein
MNVGDEMSKVEAREVRKARAAVAPILREAVSSLKGIFDKARYRRWTTQEWTPDVARAVRLRLRRDATWRAAKDNVRSIPLQSLLVKALQAGALETVDAVTEGLEKIKGISVDWELSRSEVAEAGRALVEGRTPAEHAKTMADVLLTRLETVLRQACQRQPNVQAVRSDFNRNADNAVESALTSLDRIVGDAVMMGQRYSMGQFENPILEVAK